MLFFDLADGNRFAVRPSGTEPKIKYYFFGRKIPVPGTKLSAADLPSIKSSVADQLQGLWDDIQQDIAKRI